MESSEKKEARGGKREGAGRKEMNPADKKKAITFTLSPDVIEHLHRQDKISPYVESLIRRDMKKKS